MIRTYLTKVSGYLLCAPLLAAIVNFSPVHLAQAAPACTSAITDQDGDGWGYENNQSCQFVQGHPPCSSTAIINGDWGYENGISCKVPSANKPDCTGAAIKTAEGWGWENNRSCRWVEIRQPSTPLICSANAKDNGGGWGWENNRSCRFAENSTGGGTDNSNNNNSNGTPQCSPTANDNGDGWGFEHGASCLWGNVIPDPTIGTNDGSVPPPVRPAIPGHDATGKPICLTDSSDGNHDGYGYENDQTCRVVAGKTATPQNPLLNTRWCQPWAEISYGNYVLQNNTWNDSDVWTDDWWQCIKLGGSRGSYVAQWDYNWLARNEGNEYSVKSYPQVYYGRKTRNTTSGTPTAIGLPANINNLPDFKVRYRYSETGNAERNVALESFFHTSCEAEEWNKHFEMMVWVGKPATKTPGRLVAEATIDGKDWDIYTNPALSWGYVAFVEKTPSTQGTLDWNKFVNWTRYTGPSHGVWSVGDNTCMGAIEIGTETFWGAGTFTLHEFSVYR
ncbi:hypothetical protein AB833_14475 [Chromatiales bacterium (ex Bugula neritina AB1)]|nr:hypothetical protein AB833_14475 [Chromatiales bacterium (ex Bugula neritina AB1)]